MRRVTCPAALLVLTMGTAPAIAQREHSELPRAVAAGSLVPLWQIRERLLQRLPDHVYIGAEFDPAVQLYRLKFLRQGQVLWIDVDARTGRVVRRVSS
jgi:hypothetical protein